MERGDTCGELKKILLKKLKISSSAKSTQVLGHMLFMEVLKVKYKAKFIHSLFSSTI